MTELVSAGAAARRAAEAGLLLTDSGVRHWMDHGLVRVHVRGGRRLVDVGEVLVKAGEPTRRKATKHRPRPDNQLPAAERLAVVKDLYETGLTTYAVSERLGLSQGTIAKDIKKLGISRVAAPPRKYPAPTEQECARNGCSVRFTPRASDVAKGHGRFCSRSCAVRAEPPRPRLAGQMRECKKPKCKNKFWVWNAHARRGGNKFGGYCSRQCAGKAKWVADEAAGAQGLVKSLTERGLWSTKATQKYEGRRQGHRGKVDGFEKGGRPVRWSDDPEEQGRMQARILELDQRDTPARRIALEVFGDERYRGRVARFLNR